MRTPDEDSLQLRGTLLRDTNSLTLLADQIPGARALRPDRLHLAAFLGHGAARRVLGVAIDPPRDIDRWAACTYFWGGPAAIFAAGFALFRAWADPELVDVAECVIRQHGEGNAAMGPFEFLAQALRLSHQEGAGIDEIQRVMRLGALAWAAEPFGATKRRRRRAARPCVTR